MKNKKRTKSISLEEGVYLEKEFTTYQEMAEHSPDWSLFCNYQLAPNGMDGKYRILELPNIQISCSDMVGGFMFSFEAPKDKICFSIIQEVQGYACFESIKLKAGMIVVFDDRKVYNFMSSAKIRLIDVAIDKSLDTPLIAKLLASQQMYFLDTESIMLNMSLKILENYDENSNKELLLEREETIIASLLNLMTDQKAQIPKSTKGEQIVLEIRDQIFKHMDATLSIITLAEQHHITAQTLQNSFKSLFGYTPLLFLRLLKLNLVHHELYESNPQESTVIRIAQKWGFSHMGRFSKYYKELFGKTPSTTLNEENHNDDGMRLGCVKRKEEM